MLREQLVGILGTSSLVLGREVITMVGCFRRETGEAEEAEEAVHV